MKRRIITWMLIGCMLLQNTEMTALAAGAPSSLQEETVSGNDGTEAGKEDDALKGEDEEEKGRIEGGGAEEPEAEGSEEAEKDISETETELTEIEDGQEAEELSDETEVFTEEAVGEPDFINLEGEEEPAQNVQYAQAEIESFSEEKALTADSAVKGSDGLYFGYIVKDPAMRTGTLTEYLSESGKIVLPHKLNNYYMVSIGKDAFAGMNREDTSELSKLPSQSTSGKTLMSSGEEKILELVNAARMREGKIPLVMSATLREAARRKTLDMLNKNYFDHRNTDGTYTYNWLTNCRYPWSMWAENIAYNYESAERLYDQWWNSTGHRKNMMNGSLRAIGIGVYKGSDGRIMGTQIFSSTVFQNLTTVKLEYGYESIGSGAFRGCTNLISITIPSTVTDIAEDAFDGCSSLTIYGRAGSYAQSYAEKQNIPFAAVEETCPIRKFGYEQEEVFLEKGDIDSVRPMIEPEDYRHLIKEELSEEELPEEERTVLFLEDGAVRALKDGSVTLRAHAGEKEAVCQIIVGVKNVAIQDVGFYEESMELYVGEETKPVYRVSPVNATQEVQLTSSNPEVLAVEDGGTVKALKAGEASLTVSVVDGDACDVLQVIVLAWKENLTLPEDLKAVTNAGNITLESVSLDAYPGFSWKEPKTKLMAKKGEAVQYFAAQYESKEDGSTVRQDCILPVAVSAASGQRVMMEGKALSSTVKLSLAETYELHPEVSAVGAEVDASFYDIIDVKADRPEVLEIVQMEPKTEGNWKIYPKSAGKCSVTVEMKLKDSDGSYGPAKKPYGTYKKKYTFQVEDGLYANTFHIEPAPDMADGVHCMDDGSFLVEEGVSKFRLCAWAFDKNGEKMETALAFGTDKSGVIQVRGVKGENNLAEVIVKKSGETTLTITSKDNGRRSTSVRICVQKISPQLAAKTWTLNKWKAVGTFSVNFTEAENNPIQTVELYEDRECLTESPLFTIQKDNETGAYAAGFRDQNTELVKKNSYKIYVKATTRQVQEGQAGQEAQAEQDAKFKTYVYPVTVKLKNKQPAVTWKQSAQINLFYKDTDAQLTINSGAEKITHIEQDPKQLNEIKNAPHFQAVFRQEGEVWSGTIVPVDVTAENYKKIKKKIEVLFYFQDYGKDFFIKKTLTVKCGYQKVALTASPTESSLYLKMGNDKAVFRITDKKDKSILVPGGEGNVTVTPDASMVSKAKFDVEPGRQDISVQLLGKSNLTAKVKVSHDNWREAVSCSFKIKVNQKTPSLLLSKTKVSFNKNAAGKEVFLLEASVSKNETMQVVRLKEVDIVGSSAAAKKLLEEGKLSICPQKQGDVRVLKIRLNDSSVKNGTYKYQVYGWCMMGETKIQRMSPATLSITVANKQPTVSLKAKGKIKLSDASNSGIVYTPKIANVSGTIQGAALSGSYASAFSLAPDENGAYRLRLKDMAKLTKGSYKLYLTFTLDNGVSVASKAVTVKVG